MLRLPAAGAALAVAALVGAGQVASATAPTATTGPVTAVGPTTATVSGSVNPNGTATSWYVEYGPSTSYGSKTPTTSAGSGTGSIAISATLTGLQPGSSYHYRVVATSSAGTAHGADGLLTTAAAPQVVTGSASSVTPTSATLNGTVNPSGRATTWYFEYGTSTSYGTKTQAKDAGSGTSPVAVSAQVTGLKTGSLYHFRIVATSDAGTSRGSDQTFRPAAAPTVATAAASSVRDTSAALHGTVNPNGQTTTAYFEYGTTTGYGTKTSAKNVGSGTNTTGVSISVSGLAPGTTYHVRIVASNAAGTNTGGDQSFTTTGPPAVQTGSATNVTGTSASLTASVNSRGHSTSWYFQWGPTGAYGLQTVTHSQSSSEGTRSVSEAIAGLAPGTAYHFRIVATNSSGTSYGADVVFTTLGPAITVAASTASVVAGGAVVLAGKVATGRANETVAVFAQRFASGSFTAIATVLTDAAGAWRLVVRPTIATAYKGVWNGVTSSTVTVGVRPAVSVRVLARLRFATHVAAARSFAGRAVQLQRRLLDGRWRTIARRRLDRRSTAVFRPSLPHGRSTLRVAISVNQAGAGYLAGFSRIVVVRRR
jgi:Fibronectin type III domain